MACIKVFRSTQQSNMNRQRLERDITPSTCESILEKASANQIQYHEGYILGDQEVRKLKQVTNSKLMGADLCVNHYKYPCIIEIFSVCSWPRNFVSP